MSDGSIGKIDIKRNERKAVTTGIIPDGAILRFGQSKKPNLAGTWEKIRKPRAKLEAQILIEQKLHLAVVTSRRSRSAA